MSMLAHHQKPADLGRNPHLVKLMTINAAKHSLNQPTDNDRLILQSVEAVDDSIFFATS